MIQKIDFPKHPYGHKAFMDSLVDAVNEIDPIKETIAQLQDRVVKLEIERENKYCGNSQLDEVHKKLNEQLSIANSNIDIANLDTKKEHALRLRLRDTKQQFKQLEEVHRKLKKDHAALLVKHGMLAEENIRLKGLLKGASNEEVNRLIDGTINLLRAWNPKEGSK